jgi:excisionase family DNA binding protein
MPDKEYLRIPDHVSVVEAGKMIGLSYRRTYQLVHEGRLPSTKVGGKHMIPIEEVEKYQRNPPGRTRIEAPDWYLFDANVKVFSTQIQVRVRAGQQELFAQKLQQIYEEQEYKFPGTMRRYIFKNTTAPDLVTIILLWKSNEMPGERVRENQLETFQSAFADVLDWDTAQITFNEGLLYT